MCTPEDIAEVRVAITGNVDAGKSSLLGVLTKGRLDDGRGRVRLCLFEMRILASLDTMQARIALLRHKHELETGRTSSVGLESALAFDFSSKRESLIAVD